MANITWDDKTALNPQPSVPRENKCTDDDLNEIKQVVNGNYNTLIGSIFMYAGSTAPTGYLICDGSAVSRSTYSDLFSVIGTTYGTGDGSTTFNIPNLKGKVIVGVDSNDSDFDTLGKTGGSKDLQEHYHNGQAYYDDKYTINNGGYQSGSSGIAIVIGPEGHNIKTATAGTGNSGNLQPYVVLNYIIRY